MAMHIVSCVSCGYGNYFRWSCLKNIYIVNFKYFFPPSLHVSINKVDSEKIYYITEWKPSVFFRQCPIIITMVCVTQMLVHCIWVFFFFFTKSKNLNLHNMLAFPLLNPWSTTSYPSFSVSNLAKISALFLSSLFSYKKYKP